ncbi:MAG: tRNA uridine(34) 5-carboxymethylaminomethyl modification radical SAM/GNAT enzyme Elp3 [Chloroflexi bacterium]|nr:tRNA uridine(34) 5-carboxymethylaminomethyl modification radical SAM/GNAT enzyme Elp3 [Chloroflexota bacterium]
MRKLSRTLSGVTPVAVMARPQGCPGDCVYCPNDPAVPRSYTTESPAVLRAIRCGFDARRQVEERLRMLRAMGHPTDKVELIVMGGTFLASPQEYQYAFIRGCYDGLNGASSSGLDEAKRLNERAFHRCVGLCIETRPDWCGAEEVERMLDFGATRVELGVQALDDSIYRTVKRGHRVEDVARATRLLRDYGFKVHYHWMPGLPGSSPVLDLQMFERLFVDPLFRPDGLKLYPTLVVQGTELERWYRDGRYQPYDMGELTELLVQAKALVPPYVRISRVMRDIPVRFIVAGCRDLALRDALKARMCELGAECRCIRCREYGHRVRNGWRPGEPRLRRLDYNASGGTEVFLSFEDDSDTLFGLLRLRMTGPERVIGSEEADALVRELHVYGPEVPLEGQDDGAIQHKGLGKALLVEAERIASEEFGRGRLLVLSGVGAREYYADAGYVAEGAYMARELGSKSRSIRTRKRRNRRF